MSINPAYLDFVAQSSCNSAIETHINVSVPSRKSCSSSSSVILQRWIRWAWLLAFAGVWWFLIGSTALPFCRASLPHLFYPTFGTILKVDSSWLAGKCGRRLITLGRIVRVLGLDTTLPTKGCYRMERRLRLLLDFDMPTLQASSRLCAPRCTICRPS